MLPRNNRKAKIVATVGPASNSPETLKSLFLTGVGRTFKLSSSADSRSRLKAARIISVSLRSGKHDPRSGSSHR